MKSKLLTVYILSLKDKCWYVGYTSNFTQRMKAHFDGKGSKWTKLHAPIAVEARYDDVIEEAEDMYTKKYMRKYGIPFVRGGHYHQPILSQDQIKAVTAEIDTMN